MEVLIIATLLALGFICALVYYVRVGIVKRKAYFIERDKLPKVRIRL